MKLIKRQLNSPSFLPLLQADVQPASGPQRWDCM